MANNTYDNIMSGKCNNNIRFTDLRNLIISFGFNEHIRGDHYIYIKEKTFQKE